VKPPLFQKLDDFIDNEDSDDEQLNITREEAAILRKALGQAAGFDEAKENESEAREAERLAYCEIKAITAKIKSSPNNSSATDRFLRLAQFRTLDANEALKEDQRTRRLTGLPVACIDSIYNLINAYAKGNANKFILRRSGKTYKKSVPWRWALPKDQLFLTMLVLRTGKP
jgi:hypothetical protein